ncbi:MAG: hypothetical protein HLUCCO02_03705 [Idiomarinaceae bacterium HL-53]|nr:MAG: hypothetical protein HLUCCO02_03705 [Idiomarinaceae bacterium HL-53]CUS49123.1 hypothetical protein Ga0003345_2110 [Idiomarinaceae bacterium HL-53]
MQADIFTQTQHSTAFAELCCALYEREIAQLSYGNLEPARLKNRLRSLPYYIQKAAWGLILSNSPLALDTQNASWQTKQFGRPPKPTAATSFIKWIDKHAAPGLPLPVLLTHETRTSVHLDAVDRIDYAQQKLHLNRFGWFGFEGQTVDAYEDGAMLLKPTARSMGAACAGHVWSDSGKLAPQALSLRELLLSTLLDWPNFSQVRQLKDSVAGLFN